MLTVIICAIVILAALSLLYTIGLLDELGQVRKQADEWRAQYANERQHRLDYERTIADQTRHLIDLCQKNARLKAELREMAQQPVGFFRETRGLA
jgi:chromosome segregation ATPase